MGTERLTLGDFNEYVDRVLELYFLNECINRKIIEQFDRNHKVLSKKQSVIQVLFKMEYRLGLVKKTSDSFEDTWVITDFGQKVLKHGNWTKYLYNTEKLIVEQTESVIKTNKLQRVILWFTAAFTLATLIITFLDYLRATPPQLMNKREPQKSLQEQCLDTLQKSSDIVLDSTKILKSDSLDNGVK
jgi:hypothetical protein